MNKNTEIVHIWLANVSGMVAVVGGPADRGRVSATTSCKNLKYTLFT